MERYICIHGHFYQPPRENPWLEEIEVQDSAYPYHDWNERITAECYAPNAAARIMDGGRWIVKIVNDYSKISFNFGPTLLSWMQEKAPQAYDAIIAADRLSRESFGGHGSAIAQGYNHVILPLANERDRHTQVLWGIRDFEHRFGRRPEGLWLPETAVDVATLETLAALGIRYTILAPHQAKRVRPLGGEEWQDVQGARVDPSMAYLLRLPSGRTLNVFFYDGPISRAVAFEGLLNNGEDFARRLLSGFSDERSRPQLVHIATDGESYGHHHRRGEMALAYALQYIESNNLARLTNYGQFLDLHPPTYEAEIVENSSWSCVHGIERWRSDCGCNSGRPGWHQQWRGPLRAAFDWLRDEVAPAFEERAGRLFRDPWAARDDFIAVILDRSRDSVERFLAKHAARDLTREEKVEALSLMELQRHAMLMYTSCGWFFDELSGIETVQVMQYAGRAVQLAEKVLGRQLEEPFVKRLALAKSNLAELGDGAQIYERWVKPSVIDLHSVAAHYAVSSLFESYEKKTNVYCYTVECEDMRVSQAGDLRLGIGRAKVTSNVTWDSATLSFGVIHFGDQNLSGGVREFQGEQAYEAMAEQVSAAFERMDLPHVIRLLDREFSELTYSLRSLFRDEQRKILGMVLKSAEEETEAIYRQVYDRYASLARYLASLGAPLPKEFRTAAEIVLNNDLNRALEKQTPDVAEVRKLLHHAKTWGIELDTRRLSHTLERTLERAADLLRASPADLPTVEDMLAQVDLIRSLPFEVDLWRVQNVYYDLLRRAYARYWRRLEQPAGSDQTWLERFLLLGEKLGMRVAEMEEIRRIPTFADIAKEVAQQVRIPRATYRMQFGPNFRLRDALDLVPYLDDLGISDCYASPLFQARPGSDHGYDVSDHSRLNPDLGSEEDFDAFTAALRQRGMGLVLDVVPNHMGIAHPSNLWWRDVLENGPSSVYASFFDIDWEPAKPELRNKVLLPILEDQYGTVLESGKLRLAYEDGSFCIKYYDFSLPLDPRTYSTILSHRLEQLTGILGEDSAHLLELQSILTALSYLPQTSEVAPERVAERSREKEVIKRRIAALYEASPEVRAAIDETVRIFNGTIGDPQSFDHLDALLSEQAFRPAFWRVAAEEINYRRFFDINELAAIRVEVPEVFEATHQLVLRWLSEGKVTGLRIDHPDGLWNPRAYLRTLQESYVIYKVQSRITADGSRGSLPVAIGSWLATNAGTRAAPPTAWPLYVVAEKILCEGETLSEDWAVYGTTGYDFLNAVNGIFVDSANGRAFERLYNHFAKRDGASNFRNLVNSSKKMIMLISLASEINSLAHQLERISERNRRYRDFTLNSLTFAMREVIACLPVYRTYIDGMTDGAPRRDSEYVEAAVAEAKKRNPRTAESVFNFIRDTLLLRNVGDFSEPDRERLVNFVMKFQQVTGPVMAKGVEDTAFYNYNRLVSLNEVGGNPQQFGIPVASFHQQNAERQRQWPHSMLASTTHDTKRSEDVRARIDVLSELPWEWRSALGRWSRMNAGKKTLVDGEPAPDANDEYLLYQTLIGAWPFEPMSAEEYARFRERIAGYMLKATKEAKVHTSWVNPNEEYDAAVRAFVERLLTDDPADPFLGDLLALQRRVAFFGQFNSLSQLLLKLASPGVPDIYRGTELWDFSLVDPDNRRPVDYDKRRALLAKLKSRADKAANLSTFAESLLEKSQDGRIKMYTLYRALSFRRSHSPLFQNGAYRPLRAVGGEQEHVCAFARTLGEEALVAVAPRLVVGLTGGKETPPVGEEVWGDTWLALPFEKAGRRYRNLFTGEVLAVEGQGAKAGLSLADALRRFPVALLARLAE